jgi:hypothetical protein
VSTTQRKLEQEANGIETLRMLENERLTREQRRSRRKRHVRARTISVARVSKSDRLRLLYHDDYATEIPRTRADCIDGPRPCPHVSCRHHLYLDVSPRTGAIKLNFPDLEVWELEMSCALDVADQGSTKLEQVGALMNVTRERVRQIELKALSKLEALQDTKALRQYVSA